MTESKYKPEDWLLDFKEEARDYELFRKMTGEDTLDIDKVDYYG